MAASPRPRAHISGLLLALAPVFWQHEPADAAHAADGGCALGWAGLECKLCAIGFHNEVAVGCHADLSLHAEDNWKAHGIESAEDAAKARLGYILEKLRQDGSAHHFKTEKGHHKDIDNIVEDNMTGLEMASLLGWGSMRGFKKHDLANKVSDRYRDDPKWASVPYFLDLEEEEQNTGQNHRPHLHPHFKEASPTQLHALGHMELEEALAHRERLKEEGGLHTRTYGESKSAHLKTDQEL